MSTHGHDNHSDHHKAGAKEPHKGEHPHRDSHKGEHPHRDSHHKGDHPHRDSHHKGDHPHRDSHHKGDHPHHPAHPHPPGHPHPHHDPHDHHHHPHHGGNKHVPSLRGPLVHGGRQRAGTLTRRDTMHSSGGKDKSHHREHDRQSMTTTTEPVYEYENTFKLQPDGRFLQKAVTDIIREVLAERLKGRKYDSDTCRHTCTELSAAIRERVKTLGMARFKLVCLVVLGERRDSSLLITSRCLWDHRVDNFASATLQQPGLYAVGMVFAVYQE